MKTYEQFITEATAVAKAKFKKQFDTVRHSDAFQDTQYKRGSINPWHLTGHNPGGKYGTSKAVEAMKEKVFGKRRKGTSDLLFLHHDHGIITHPAVGDITHSDVLAYDGPGLGIDRKPRKGIKINRKIQAKVMQGGFGGIQGQGRIEHHEGGGGIISYSHRGIGSVGAAIRTIARAYPKYKIHDGQGNLLEAEDFKSKWNRLLDSPEWQKSPRETTQWQLTGHNPGTKHGTTHEIEKAKERVFGKRRGNTDLFWLHFHHGIVTHPAKGDIVHMDVEENRKRKGVKVDKKIQAKVAEGGIGSRWGVGRIEHHEGGGGIITYYHRGGVPKSSAVRMISREYPKYNIHDGTGNELHEATATKRKKPTRKEKAEFADKFDQVKHSDAFSNLQDKRYARPWHLTGHNPNAKHGTSKAVEAMKEKVFGKRRKGTSDLLFMHKHHGIVTHPAIGDTTHQDVIDHLGKGKRKGIRVNKKIQAKVKEGGMGALSGYGRIEHHEGGGGIISYSHASMATPKSAAVRTIARAYPKYQIHDGHGNLLEATTVVKAKKPPLSYAEKFKKLRGDLAKTSDTTAQVAAGEHGSWILTGHDSMGSLSSESIRKAKDRVFGKRQGDSHILFFHKHHGIVTHPAVGELTHQDIHTNPKHLSHHIDQNVRAKVTGVEKANIIGQGRIEHHKNGGGMISIVGRDRGEEAPLHPSALRTLRRAYPKHFIHDGHGNELNENWSYAHNFHEMPDSEKQKYVYHVTTAARAAKIVKGGLKPRSPKGRTNYPDAREHTQGHAFVTNHHGVNYWRDQTAHAVNRRKREVDENDYENIHVLKFPIANLKKSTRRKLRTDELGTKDARKHDDNPLIDPSSHEASTAIKIRKKIREDTNATTTDTRRTDQRL